MRVTAADHGPQTADDRRQTTDDRQQTAKQQTADSRQQTADSRRQTTDDRQQRTDGRRQTADNRRRTAGGRQQTTDNREQTADSKQQTANSKRRLLGLDVGARRIGVAVSQGLVAVPLTIIAHESRAADIARIGELARAEGANAIVVGLPLSMSGEENAQAARTRAFGEALSLGTGLSVVYQDERLSTVEASRASIGGGRMLRPPDPRSVHPARRRGRPRVDDLAAAVILQAYLDAR